MVRVELSDRLHGMDCDPYTVDMQRAIISDVDVCSEKGKVIARRMDDLWVLAKGRTGSTYRRMRVLTKNGEKSTGG